MFGQTCAVVEAEGHVARWVDRHVADALELRFDGEALPSEVEVEAVGEPRYRVAGDDAVVAVDGVVVVLVDVFHVAGAQVGAVAVDGLRVVDLRLVLEDAVGFEQVPRIDRIPLLADQPAVDFGLAVEIHDFVARVGEVARDACREVAPRVAQRERELDAFVVHHAHVALRAAQIADLRGQVDRAQDAFGAFEEPVGRE